MPYIHRLPSGNWRAIVKHAGLAKSVTAKTKGECLLRAAEAIIAMGGKDILADGAGVTVEELIDMHLLAVKDDWSPTTWHDANSLAKRLPEPFRGRMVADVDAPIVAALYRELTSDGWSPHRLRRVRLILSTAWTTAISYRWASINPTRDARMPKLPHRDITPPDQGTVDLIFAATHGQFELFLRLAAATGARRGELIALRWTDLALDRDYALCRIATSLVCTTDGIAERDTKTSVKGHRTIKLGPLLTKRLLEHRDVQRDKADGFTPEWVFSHAAGATPWRPDYASREFARVCKKAGVTGVRLHDLRHHLATDQLAKGRSVQAVAQRLGHSSIATTQRTYNHWIEEGDEMADDLDG